MVTFRPAYAQEALQTRGAGLGRRWIGRGGLGTRDMESMGKGHLQEGWG